jgi:hypothetical protein
VIPSGSRCVITPLGFPWFAAFVMREASTSATRLNRMGHRGSPLPQPLKNPKEWGSFSINVYTHSSTLDNAHDLLSPLLGKALSFHHLLYKVPPNLVVSLLEVNLEDHPSIFIPPQLMYDLMQDHHTL